MQKTIEIYLPHLKFHIRHHISLNPSFTHFTGLNYSSAGIRVHFHRNNISLLIGGYYAPTMIFALLSQVSYSIDIHMVC